MDDPIDVTIADRSDQVPLDLLDEVVSEYERDIAFDGLALVREKS